MAKKTPEQAVLERIKLAASHNWDRLDLSKSHLETIPREIGNLIALKELNISHNNFRALPPEISQLSNLDLLDLTGNKLSYLPVGFEALQKLTTLSLSHNQFSTLPALIKNLTTLRSVNLSNNYLKILSPELLFLPELISLNLSVNQIAFLPSEIGQFKKLAELDVSINQLLTLPPEIAQLSRLNSLNLSLNKIIYLPAEIGKLRNLKFLDLSFNQLEKLPAEIGLLLELNSIILTANKLTILPEEIGNLINLIMINFSYNPIPRLPKTSIKLKKLKFLMYGDTKLPFKPPEIKNSIEAILAYYANYLGKHLNEVKLLIVGEGSVGKTSLVNRILHDKFDNNQLKTEGISIHQWTIDDGQQTISSEVNSQSSIKLNIWDFGGQEIMHATHQFFLTKRSLYLLVLDARLTQDENRVEYWLKIIQSFGGESPVLIVGNKTDQHPLDIDRTGLRNKYLNIVGILETSAATSAGIEALKGEIAKQVDTLPHVRDLLPETWFTVKSKLEKRAKKKNFITQEEYLRLCDTNNVTDETSQRTLISFLHDLGVVLHFQDDPRLEALGILNPQWVTNGVYKILNSRELFQNQGQLTLPLLNKILNMPEYPRGKHLFIVDMMKKFELCYDIEPDKSFLVPDLLPKDEIYTGEWKDALAFQYHYKVLPSSIITRFIVRMNVFIHKNTIWRSGVVLKYDDNTALIKADIEDRKIYIYVSGKEETRRDLLAMIRGQFDTIHKTIAKIEVAEKVPLPNAPEAAPVDLIFLQRLANEGRKSLPVQVGNRIIDLLVKEVLSEIEKDSSLAEKNTVVHIHGNVRSSTITVGDNNTIALTQAIFEPVYGAIETSSSSVAEKNDLIADVNEIKNEVAKGGQANESFLTRRLRNLKNTAPDIADVALAALTGPGAAISTIAKKVAGKIKEEGKKT